MRDIKFRAWDEVNKCMIYDMFYIGSEGVVWLDQDPHGVDISGRRKISITDKLHLMQFTGLKDKNGKCIYEGDVIKGFSASIPCYEIFHDKYMFRIRYKLKSGDFYDWGPLYRVGEVFNESHPKREIEVIGNIFDNPELITQTN